MKMKWKEQYSVGDQKEQKRAFWNSSYKTCPVCNGQDLHEKEEATGSRMNGDAYGVDTYTCQSCGWKTSFRWDDASQPYHFETRNWTRDEP